MAGRLDIFHRPIGKQDSELKCEVSFLTQCFFDLEIHSHAIIRMYPLQYRLPVRQAPQRIKFPDSIAFL